MKNIKNKLKKARVIYSVTWMCLKKIKALK